MQPAQALCRIIGMGAFGTGLVMIVFSRSVEATSQNAVTDAVVHVSNVKFMAAMWCVVGLILFVGAAHLDEAGAWRIVQLVCGGISASAIVRLIEMVRLDEFSGYGLIAAAAELIFPPSLIYLRRRAYPKASA